jgi:hypothetical protein
MEGRIPGVVSGDDEGLPRPMEGRSSAGGCLGGGIASWEEEIGALRSKLYRYSSTFIALLL